MKDWYKKWWVWAIAIIVLLIVIVIPFVINESYKSNSGYMTLWGAADVLAFYGSLLSFIGTVVLGIIAVWQNKKANDINDKLLNLDSQKKKEQIFEMYFSFIDEAVKMYDIGYVLGDLNYNRLAQDVYFAVNNCRNSALCIKRRLMFLDQENYENEFLDYAMNQLDKELQIVFNHLEKNTNPAQDICKFIEENSDEYNEKSLYFMIEIYNSIFKEETPNE